MNFHLGPPPKKWFLSLALGALGLSGCSQRPIQPYVPPVVQVPEAFSAAPIEGKEAGDLDLALWWESFADPTLTSLIERGLSGSLDLKAALARLQEARALRGTSTQALLPSWDASTGYTRTRNSAETPTGSFLPRYVDDFSLGADVTWEVDVWGRVREGVRAADAQIGVQLEDTRAVLLLLASEIAESYLEVRTAQAREAIARANAKVQEETLSLTRSRFEAGLVSELDVSQAASLLAETRAGIPTHVLASQVAQNHLAVLLGSHPGSLAAELRASAPIPSPSQEVSMGIPADLVRRRPDLRRRERELAVASARLGLARAELYPRFSLGGFLGFRAQDLPDLITNPARAFTLGPLLRWKIFNRRALRAQVRAGDARVDGARLAYEQAVLVALEESENALKTLVQTRQRQVHLAASIGHAEKALSISRERYRKGLVGFQSVLDSQRRLVGLEDAEALARAAISKAHVALYKSLGGGWQGRPLNSGSSAPEDKELP